MSIAELGVLKTCSSGKSVNASEADRCVRDVPAGFRHQVYRMKYHVDRWKLGPQSAKTWSLCNQGPEQGIKLLGLLLTGSTGQRMASRNGLA